MKKSAYLFTVLSLLFLNISIYAWKGGIMQSITDENLDKSRTDSLKITILYDNYVFNQDTKSDWGFSCLIESSDKTILFDTGTKGELLLNNIDALNIDLAKVDLLVLSHIHSDHTGGIPSVISRNSDLIAYVPVSFPKDFGEKNRIRELKRVDEAVEICKGVYSTGEMGDFIKEQSLIINTKKGLVIITGCAHQGILSILSKTKEIFNKKIYLVIGGFHLLQKSDTEMKDIIIEFKRLGVKKCGATHCTGEKQIQMFKEAFGENYVEMGTGRILKITE